MYGYFVSVNRGESGVSLLVVYSTLESAKRRAWSLRELKDDLQAKNLRTGELRAFCSFDVYTSEELAAYDIDEEDIFYPQLVNDNSYTMYFMDVYISKVFLDEDINVPYV